MGVIYDSNKIWLSTRPPSPGRPVGWASEAMGPAAFFLDRSDQKKRHDRAPTPHKCIVLGREVAHDAGGQARGRPTNRARENVK